LAKVDIIGILDILISILLGQWDFADLLKEIGKRYKYMGMD